MNTRILRMGLKSALLLSVLLLIAPDIVRACGGIFTPPDESVYQDALRVVFGVDKANHTITEIIGMNYSGNAKDFSWIMPLPSTPQVNVDNTTTDLDNLEGSTGPQFTNVPPDYCTYTQQLKDYQEARGGGGPPSFFEGQVGPYDYAIIRNVQADEMLAWLKKKGYNVPDDARSTLAQYVYEGDVFLAMHLTVDAQQIQDALDAQNGGIPYIHQISPVVLTYQSDKVVLPARMGGATGATGPIRVWILSDRQYLPGNYAHPSLEPMLSTALTNLRMTPETSQIGGYYRYSFDGSAIDSNPVSTAAAAYSDVVAKLSDQYNGQMFVTDYAGPTSPMLQAG